MSIFFMFIYARSWRNDPDKTSAAHTHSYFATQANTQRTRARTFVFCFFYFRECRSVHLLFENCYSSIFSAAVEEHFMCTDVEWDPSGRFVATWVSAWKLQVTCIRTHAHAHRAHCLKIATAI